MSQFNRRILVLGTLCVVVGGVAGGLSACKDNSSEVPMVKAPPGVHGPTTAEVLAKPVNVEQYANPADFEVPKLLGMAVAETMYGITWQKFPCGLCVKDYKEGTGYTPQAGQTVAVNYTGTIPGTDRVFDHSPIGKPFQFVLGKIRGDGTVIEGWQLAISTMKVGGKRKVLIPPDLAYGDRGSPPTIGPNQTLMFDLELVSIKGDPVNLAPSTKPAATQKGVPVIDDLIKTLVGPTTKP